MAEQDTPISALEAVDAWDEAGAEPENKYLTFKVEKNIYALEVAYVAEIIGMQKTTPMPNASPYIKGVINIRGTIVPLIDIRLRFGLPDLAYTDRTCIAVLETGDIHIGLIVEEVQDVIIIAETEIKPSPGNPTQGFSNTYVRGVCITEGKIRQILDLTKVLALEEENQ